MCVFFGVAFHCLCRDAHSAVAVAYPVTVNLPVPSSSESSKSCILIDGQGKLCELPELDLPYSFVVERF